MVEPSTSKKLSEAARNRNRSKGRFAPDGIADQTVGSTTHIASEPSCVVAAEEAELSQREQALYGLAIEADRHGYYVANAKLGTLRTKVRYLQKDPATERAISEYGKEVREAMSEWVAKIKAVLELAEKYPEIAESVIMDGGARFQRLMVAAQQICDADDSGMENLVEESSLFSLMRPYAHVADG